MGRAKVVLFFWLAVMVPSGFGGLITFTLDPETKDDAGNNLKFSTMVYNTLPDNEFTSIMVVIKNNAPLTGSGDSRISFEFDPNLIIEYPEAIMDEVPMGTDGVWVNFGSGSENGSQISSLGFYLGKVVIFTEGLSHENYMNYWITLGEEPSWNSISCGELYSEGISSLPVNFVPEPASLLLFLGFGALGLRAKKRYD